MKMHGRITIIDHTGRVYAEGEGTLEVIEKLKQCVTPRADFSFEVSIPLGPVPEIEPGAMTRRLHAVAIKEDRKRPAWKSPYGPQRR